MRNINIKKFIIFSGLLIALFSVILYPISLIGIPYAILAIAILSVALRIIVDKYGDGMLTDSKVYMSRDDIQEFGKKKIIFEDGQIRVDNHVQSIKK